MSLFNQFYQDQRGNVAMMFSLAVVGFIGMAGLALEYTHGSMVKSRLTAAADAAALAAAKATGTVAERKKAGEDIFFASLGSVSGTSNHNVTITPVMANGDVTGFPVTAKADMETTLGRIFGHKTIDIGAVSQANAGAQENYEIAMVLDTTGSMSGAELATLKTAAKDLVDKLSAKSQAPDQIKFALVPFSQWVNVGLANRSATWIDVPADYTETKTVDVYTYPNKVETNCRTEQKTGYNDGVPYTYDATVCDTVLGDPVITPTEQTYNHKWNGCVGSRNYPLNTGDSSYLTRVPGLLNHWCPGEIMPLTSDMAKVKASVDAMSAYGNTYIPSGLIWGWRVLSPGAPFNETAKGGTTKVNQVMIVMTDGANTKSPQYPDHWGTDTVLANDLTKETCANIKKDGGGIQVFTIAFEVTDVAIKTILQNCASSPANYFDASDATKLTAAFSKIADQLAALHLSK